MYFKIEFHPKVGQWVIYICNRWIYQALCEPLKTGPEGDTKMKPKVYLFPTYDEALAYAQKVGLDKTYLHRKFNHENQIAPR